MPVIRVKNGPHKGKIYEIADVNISIGRDDTQTIQVLDQGISRQHAEIFKIGEMCFVRDLDSTNGTFVNGKKIAEELLRSGDEVVVGMTNLLFEDKSASTIFKESPHVEMEGKEDDGLGPTMEIKIADGIGAESKQHIRATEVESRNLTSSYTIGKIIASEKDPVAMLQKVLEHIAEATSAKYAYLFMVDKKTGKLAAKAIVEAERQNERKVSRTIVKRVLQTAKPLLSSDAAIDERFSLSESVILKKISSVMASPVIIRDKVEGMLYLHDKRTGAPFIQSDLELLASTSIMLGMAISTLSTSGAVQKNMVGTINALVRAMEIINPKTQGHSERVANYSVAVAAQMGLSQHEIQMIRLSALLHDVGKLAVHHAESEKEKGREQHVALGEKMLSHIEGFGEILPGVKFHHEKANGSGYPYGVKNDETPVMARIIIVTNTFDNMCTIGGVGGEGIPVKDALIDIGRGAGTEFDAKVTESLLVAHRNGTLYAQPKSLFEV